MKKSLVVLLIVLIFLVLPRNIFAASITFTESPSITTVTPQDELSFKVKLTINTANDTNYYLRGVFYKKGTSNYCGYTWNGDDFFSGPYSTNEGWKQFLKATIQDNNWEGEVKVKIDSNDSGCRDSGEYAFKLQRFTETGSGTFDTQDEKIFTFQIPTPTPTPTPTDKPTPTSKLVKTQIPTKSIQSLIPTKSLGLSKNISTTSSEVSPKNNVTSSNSDDTQVLGANNNATQNPTDENIKSSDKNPLGKLIIILGGALLASSFGILLFKKYKKEKELSLEEV